MRQCHSSVSFPWVTLPHLPRHYQFTRLVHMCDMTHSCVWHDSCICVTWRIHVCDMTHSCVWHDSFICVTWRAMRQCHLCECNDAVSHIWMSDNVVVSLQCHSHMSHTAICHTRHAHAACHSSTWVTHPTLSQNLHLNKKKSLNHRSGADSCTWATLGSQLSHAGIPTESQILEYTILCYKPKNQIGTMNAHTHTQTRIHSRAHSLKHKFTPKKRYCA